MRFQIFAVCEKVGADVNKVRQGIGSDSRIGFSFIHPGWLRWQLFPEGRAGTDGVNIMSAVFKNIE